MNTHIWHPSHHVVMPPVKHESAVDGSWCVWCLAHDKDKSAGAVCRLTHAPGPFLAPGVYAGCGIYAQADGKGQCIEPTQREKEEYQRVIVATQGWVLPDYTVTFGPFTYPVSVSHLFIFVQAHHAPAVRVARAMISIMGVENKPLWLDDRHSQLLFNLTQQVREAITRCQFELKEQ